MERKLKILFLVSNDHYTDQRMQRICATIHKKGHSVVLAGRDSANPQLIFPYNVSLIKLRYTQGPKFYYELMRKQIKFGKQLQGVDIVSSVDADTLLAAKAVAKYHNAKHVHDAHEWFTEVPELIGRPLKKWLWSKIEMFVLKHVDSMYTVSEGLAEYYQTCTNVPVKLVKNYPYARTCPSSIDKEYDIIYQGALNMGEMFGFTS